MMEKQRVISLPDGRMLLLHATNALILGREHHTSMSAHISRYGSGGF